MKTRPPPLRIVSFAVPTLGHREAEAVIDLLGQIQSALWEAYGDAIIKHADDGEPVAEEPSRSSKPDEDPPF